MHQSAAASNPTGDDLAVLILDGYRFAFADISGCEAVIVIVMTFDVTALVRPVSVRSNPNAWTIWTDTELNLG